MKKDIITPNIFLRRPILSIVISLMITLAGSLAIIALPVAQYPDLVPPTVNVTVAYAGRYTSGPPVCAIFFPIIRVNCRKDVFNQKNNKTSHHKDGGVK